ncbi:hypothetical protein F5890DRAFT_704577 [Lentinula detonsa]|uniref:Uncharacterized protein n=1 Tax=Lentinula detonsa TaxID=2804962 RepID=A0AA38QB86_9AGAR|nr:hypothetical protein F5890DRAFT_704577 [Lentinula detonsa]
MTFPSHAAAFSRIRDVFGVHLSVLSIIDPTLTIIYVHILKVFSLFACESLKIQRATGLISFVLFLRIVDCPSAFLNTRRVRKRISCRILSSTL